MGKKNHFNDRYLLILWNYMTKLGNKILSHTSAVNQKSKKNKEKEFASNLVIWAVIKEGTPRLFNNLMSLEAKTSQTSFQIEIKINPKKPPKNKKEISIKWIR